MDVSCDLPSPLRLFAEGPRRAKLDWPDYTPPNHVAKAQFSSLRLPASVALDQSLVSEGFGRGDRRSAAHEHPTRQRAPLRQIRIPLPRRRAGPSDIPVTIPNFTRRRTAVVVDSV